MIKKTENCLYCGEKMESKTAKKKFCCPLHRVYWNRENAKASTTKPPILDTVNKPVVELPKSELTSFERLRNKKLGI